MKARQKNKQAEKWKALFKEYNEWLSQYVYIPKDLLKRMADIRAKAQENREKGL